MRADSREGGVPLQGSAESSSPRGGVVAWYTVSVCLILYLFSQVDRQIVNLLVAPIQAAFGIGDFKMGLLMGPAFGVFYAFATFPLAWLADRVSRRAVVFGAIVFWAIAACASGLARSYEELFVARMAVGIGEAALLPSSYVLVSQLFKRERLATALSVLSMGSVGGMGLAFGLGGWLSSAAGRVTEVPFLGALEPWRLVFILSGAPGFLLAFLILTVPDTSPHKQRTATEHSQSLLTFLRQHRFVACGALLGFGLVSLCSTALSGWLPTYLIRTFGWNTAQAGMAAGLMVLAIGTVGKIGSGLIVDHWFARGVLDAHLRYLMWMSFVAAPFAAAAFLIPQVMICLALVGAYFLLPYANMGYGSAFVQLVTPPPLRGQTSALFLFGANMFAMLGPSLVGWLSEKVFVGSTALAWSLATVVGGGLACAALVLFYSLAAARVALAQDSIQA